MSEDSTKIDTALCYMFQRPHTGHTIDIRAEEADGRMQYGLCIRWDLPIASNWKFWSKCITSNSMEYLKIEVPIIV